MHRIIRKLLVVVLLLLSVVAIPVRPASAHPEGFHVLVFSKTAAGSYRHDSIPAALSMFDTLAAQRGWELTKTEDSGVFNSASLATYDVVVMLQTSGMVWDNDAQRTAFQNYARNGGGVAAIHNATDMNIEQQFPWWDQFLGMTMTAHSATVPGTAKVADRKHASGAGLPDRWNRTEEWYNFNRSARGDVHVLVTADETTYTAGPSAMGHDHPISWCRNYQGGRLWATGMGHTASSYSEPLMISHIAGGVETAGGLVAADCGPTVWGNYEKTELDGNTVAPGAVDVAADGRVFFIEYGGALKIYKPTTRTTVTAGTLPVYSGGEDGLTGMVLDPNFATNGYVYLNYSPTGSQEIARVSRFSVNGDSLDRTSERVLLTIPSSRVSEPGHTGGHLAFGPGGNLYVGVGDDTNPFESDGYAPVDERPGRALFDAQGTSANTNDLRGKVLRIHPEVNGTYTIPSGNLFAPGTAQTRPEIYAMGFRNPFRFSVNPDDGTLYVADYGPDAGADNGNRGPGGIVEWNVIASPGNYGWPYCVGNNTPFNDYNFSTGSAGAKFNCGAAVNNSPNNTGLTNLPAPRAADVWYGNSASVGGRFPELGAGGSGGEAPMAFPAYQYDANNSSPTKFPAYFDNTPFFGEWSRNTMHEMRLDSSGRLLKINRFLANLGFRSPMDMKFGPDGSMYLLEWGAGFGRNNPDSGLYRIDYTGGVRNPIAVASGTPTSGSSPLTVQFSSAGSSDPQGGPLSYRWTFGDGETSTAANPAHTYTAPGQVNAQLTVTSGARSGTSNVIVTVGNAAPTVRFSSPPNGGMFSFDQTVPYSVAVTDPEDGTIDCSRVVTVPSLGHDQHSHDVAQITGCSGVLRPQTDTAHAEANVTYIADTSYTDQGASGVPALTGRAQVVLQPKNKQAEYFTGSAGVRVVPQAGAQSGARVGDISNNDWISFTPMNLSGINQVQVRASSPNGSGSVEFRAGSPTGTLLASAPITSTGGWDTYVNLPAVSITNPGSTINLYAVFKSTADNSYDVDSFTFIGPGVSAPAQVAR